MFQFMKDKVDIISLREDVRKLKEEKMELEYKKKMEIEEIKHLNRLAQEKRDIELEREKAKLQAEYNKKAEKLEIENKDNLMKKMDEYHKATASDLRGFNKEMKETTLSIYKDIIARLPNVNVRMRVNGDTEA